MLEAGHGNLLKAEVDALVNTVNTVGVMGKGIALQFKKAFPENYKAYEKACKAHSVEVGRMFVFNTGQLQPRFIINFPTKKHWRSPSTLEYVDAGLEDLVRHVQRLGIRSIAIPPLGCGHGGLDWSLVRPRIEEAFSDLPEVRVVLFAPSGTPEPGSMVNRTEEPSMTPGRAALILLMSRYLETGYDYRLALVELQKLAYFLQLAGEPLRLRYDKHFYGPYADNLRHVLNHIEGHFTRGYGAGQNAPETPIELLPRAVERAMASAASNHDMMARIERVARLIDGFETPFGMELLGTVHWAATHDGIDPGDLAAVTGSVQQWSRRKAHQMKPAQIEAAWRRLESQRWFEA